MSADATVPVTAWFADYQGSHVKKLSLEELQLLHRLSFGHRNQRSYLVVLHQPTSKACQELEAEVMSAARPSCFAAACSPSSCCSCHLMRSTQASTIAYSMHARNHEGSSVATATHTSVVVLVQERCHLIAQSCHRPHAVLHLHSQNPRNLLRSGGEGFSAEGIGCPTITVHASCTQIERLATGLRHERAFVAAALDISSRPAAEFATKMLEVATVPAVLLYPEAARGCLRFLGMTEYKGFVPRLA